MAINQLLALLVREKVEMDPYIDDSGSGHVPGMSVLRVDENGPSGQAGIQPGDTITAIGGDDVTTAAFFKERLQAAIDAGGSVEVMVSREGRDMALVIEIPEGVQPNVAP